MTQAAGPGKFGYYHPSTEEEIIALVKKAHDEGRQIRVRGAAHSYGRAIYTDPNKVEHVQVEHKLEPNGAGRGINIMLDRYNKIKWDEFDNDKQLVTVQAGIHLGKAPHDIMEASTEENSLLYQLDKKGLALADLGGITHQTVGGFLSTGSAGGSCTYSIEDNLYKFRMIDGKGKVYVVTKKDENFHAFAVSMGLLGIISEVTFKCHDKYNITGRQRCTSYQNSPVNLFDDPTMPNQSDLVPFFKSAQYSRILWWPQPTAERLQIWTADRMDPGKKFVRKPFKEFGLIPPTLAQILMASFLVLINNKSEGDSKEKFKDHIEQFRKMVKEELKKLGNSEQCADNIAACLAYAIECMVNCIYELVYCGGNGIKPEALPGLLKMALNVFAPFDPMNKPGGQEFTDFGYKGLPMDNETDDILGGLDFSEIYIPLKDATKATTALKKHFEKKTDENDAKNAAAALKRTGTFCWELYSHPPSPAWMSMAYTNKEDEWKDGAFRIGLYWYIDSDGDPQKFFEQAWKVLHEEKINFRLHWGKVIPKMGVEDRTDINWSAILKKQYPRCADFLKLRSEYDPQEIFLTDYWRDFFSLHHDSSDTKVKA